jgi:hypothetical protein
MYRAGWRPAAPWVIDVAPPATNKSERGEQ